LRCTGPGAADSVCSDGGVAGGCSRPVSLGAIRFAMIAFEVHLNGKKVCTAGVGELGVLTTNLAWRGPQPYQKGGPSVADYLRLDVGGLAASGEHLRWLDRKLRRGDAVTIKVVEVDSTDRPRERQPHNPAAELRRQKQYVRRMAKQFGWKLQV
jgi:hypothetical protein